VGANHAPNTNPKIAKSQANCRILIESKYTNHFDEIATSHVALPRSLRTTLNAGQNIITSGHRVWELERGSKNENGHQLFCAIYIRIGSCVTSAVCTTVRNCTRDEGEPFEVYNQVLISNHRKLLLSKAMVVSVAKTPGQDSGRQG
jgi:hypothetical protein